jgi:hypothetical protein
MTRYNPNNATATVTALVVSVLISATSVMAASSIRVADIIPTQHAAPQVMAAQA